MLGRCCCARQLQQYAPAPIVCWLRLAACCDDVSINGPKGRSIISGVLEWRSYLAEHKCLRAYQVYTTAAVTVNSWSQKKKKATLKF